MKRQWLMVLGLIGFIMLPAVNGFAARGEKRNDMAGDEPDSWKSVLGKKGYTCEAVLEGTAGYPEIVDVRLDHLRVVLTHFGDGDPKP